MMGTCYCNNNNETNKQKCCQQKVLNTEQDRKRKRERLRLGEQKSFHHHQNALRPNLNVFELRLRLSSHIIYIQKGTKTENLGISLNLKKKEAAVTALSI